MPRRAKGARLYLRRRRGREAQFVIRDGSTEIGTGCGADECRGAERALERYLAQKFEPRLDERDPRRLSVAEILTAYARVQAPHHADPELVGYSMGPLLDFWGERPLYDIRAQSCREYVTWRCAQRRKVKSAKGPAPLIAAGTARRELECLQAALNCWHRESPIVGLPAVTLPAKAPPRVRHLTRGEAARLIAAARRRGLTHIARFVLIGLYTGTRHSAILGLSWLPSPTTGWIDCEAGLIHRRGQAERETNKRRPPARLPNRLLAHLRRWRALDARDGIAHVVTWMGNRLAKERRAFARAVAAAGLGPEVTPHVLKHTCATWALSTGMPIWDVAQLMGTSAAMIEATYGHHSPAFQERIASAFTRRRA